MFDIFTVQVNQVGTYLEESFYFSMTYICVLFGFWKILVQSIIVYKKKNKHYPS